MSCLMNLSIKESNICIELSQTYTSWIQRSTAENAAFQTCKDIKRKNGYYNTEKDLMKLLRIYQNQDGNEFRTSDNWECHQSKFVKSPGNVELYVR